jgi:hypothetical protein
MGSMWRAGSLPGDGAVERVPQRWVARWLAPLRAWLRGGVVVRCTIVPPADGGGAANRRWN